MDTIVHDTKSKARPLPHFSIRNQCIYRKLIFFVDLIQISFQERIYDTTWKVVLARTRARVGSKFSTRGRFWKVQKRGERDGAGGCQSKTEKSAVYRFSISSFYPLSLSFPSFPARPSPTPRSFFPRCRRCPAAAPPPSSGRDPRRRRPTPSERERRCPRLSVQLRFRRAPFETARLWTGGIEGLPSAPLPPPPSEATVDGDDEASSFDGKRAPSSAGVVRPSVFPVSSGPIELRAVGELWGGFAVHSGGSDGELLRGFGWVIPNCCLSGSAFLPTCLQVKVGSWDPPRCL